MLCQPTMVFDTANPSKDPERGSQGSSSGTYVEDPAMVPSPPAAPVWHHTPYSNTGEHGDITNSTRIHNTLRGSSASHFTIARSQCRSDSLSAEALELLAASWRARQQ